jgi:hypothetical protein
MIVPADGPTVDAPRMPSVVSPRVPLTRMVWPAARMLSSWHPAAAADQLSLRPRETPTLS